MLKSFAAYAAVAVVAIAASVSMAQSEPEQPVYLDDRSTPEQLVLSYFNAINRV
jgi:anti-sigma-K factor RskA